MVRQHEEFFKQAHKEIQKFYNDSGLDYLPTAEHQTHAIFDRKNQDQDENGKKLTRRHITQIHRVRKGGFRQDSEYVYFYEEHLAHDHRGNEIEKFVVNGKYDKPFGQFQYDEITGQNMCIGVARFETIYEIPFDTKMLDDAVDSGEIDGSTTYYVQTVNGREYSGFEYEDFRNLSFEDLIYVGKTGMRPEQRLIEAKTKDKRAPKGLEE